MPIISKNTTNILFYECFVNDQRKQALIIPPSRRPLPRSPEVAAAPIVRRLTPFHHMELFTQLQSSIKSHVDSY